MMIDAARLDAAILAADPGLILRRRQTGEMEKPSKAWTDETTSLENAARVRVRRVIAALNGIDVERNAAPWTDPPALLTREIVTELCSALCDEVVFAAIEKTIGADRAAALMGAITAL